MCPEKPVPADIPSGKLGAICQDLVFPSFQSFGEGKHGKHGNRYLSSLLLHQPSGGRNIPIPIPIPVQQFYFDCVRCQCPENV